jgi:hypothetical protein
MKNDDLSFELPAKLESITIPAEGFKISKINA